MAAGILIPKNEDFSEWYNQMIMASGLGDSALVCGCEYGRTFGRGSAWRCGYGACEHAEDADTTATMRGILLDGEHGELSSISGGNLAHEKAHFDRVN